MSSIQRDSGRDEEVACLLIAVNCDADLATESVRNKSQAREGCGPPGMCLPGGLPPDASSYRRKVLRGARRPLELP